MISLGFNLLWLTTSLKLNIVNGFIASTKNIYYIYLLISIDNRNLIVKLYKELVNENGLKL